MKFNSMYCDVCMQNEKSVIEAIQNFYDKLDKFTKAKECTMTRFTSDEEQDFVKHHRFINRR